MQGNVLPAFGNERLLCKKSDLDCQGVNMASSRVRSHTLQGGVHTVGTNRLVRRGLGGKAGGLQECRYVTNMWVKLEWTPAQVLLGKLSVLNDVAGLERGKMLEQNARAELSQCGKPSEYTLLCSVNGKLPTAGLGRNTREHYPTHAQHTPNTGGGRSTRHMSSTSIPYPA